jgi:hypothetical protein
VQHAFLIDAFILGLPLLAVAASLNTRARDYLVSLMIFATVLGDHGSINLVSHELYRGPDRGFEITGADLVCWALVLAFMRFPGRLDWFPRNSVWMLLFFLYACVLTTVSSEPLFAAFSLWKCLRIYCLYWCTVNSLRLGTHRQYIWLGFAGAAAVLTVLAIEQKYLYDVYRIYATFDAANTVPIYANLILPVLLVWALCDRELTVSRSVLSIVLSLGLLFAVLCTFSRTGQALAIASVIGALGWANLRSSSSRVRTGSLLLMVALAAGAIRATQPIIDRFRTAPEASAIARDEFNRSAALILRDHPFGIGLNNFSYVLAHEIKYRAHFRVMRYEQQPGVCHQIYWLTAAETGYPGLLLYLLLMARFTWDAIAGSFRRKSIEGTLLFGIFLGFCTLHASGFYEFASRVTPPMQLLAISGAIAVAWRKQEPLMQTAPCRAPARRAFTVCSSQALTV